MNETVRFTAVSVVIASVIIGVVWYVAGTWPPFMFVISGSMEPAVSEGSMVFLNETDDEIDNGTSTGDIVVFEPNGDADRLIIHRTVIYVEEGENWVDHPEIDEDHLTYSSCDLVDNCPAPNSGYITKGDANEYYDQASDLTKPVETEWIESEKRYEIPYLGSFAA